MRNRCMFEKMAAGMALAAAVMAGAAVLPGSGYGLVVKAYAADASNQNSQNISGGGTRSKDGVDKTGESGSKEGDAEAGAANGEGIYDFKDNKTTGTITITKKWDDGLTNAEREIPDMYLSTEKPSKSTKGYTVTFHGNGLKFADGTDENMVVYNSSGQIVEGSYKEAVGTGVAWYSDKTCKNRVETSDDGIPQIELTGDLDLWAKEMTFTLVDGNTFYTKIPKNATEVIFTDETEPKSKETIDIDADGDGGVVAWLDDDAGTVMKVSTQIPGIKVQAATDSGNMFFSRSKLQKIDFKMLDTQNVMYMNRMFQRCDNLSDLINITGLNTSNVIKMDYMFAGCVKLEKIDCSSMDAKKVTSAINMFCYCKNLSKLRLPTFSEKLEKINKRDQYAHVISSGTSWAYGMFEKCYKLTNIDLAPLNTSNITDMSYMFIDCSGLASLDLSPLDTSKVTSMYHMFGGCRGLTSLDLSSFNTQRVTNMSGMFYGCSGLANLDLAPLNTQNVTSMDQIFYDCRGLTSLDLTPLDTQNVTDMSYMFSGCVGLTSLDLSPLDTQNVTDMNDMFQDCSGLTSLDLSPLDTQNVTNMSYMFRGCSGLTSLNLTPLDTHNVTSMYQMFRGCSGLTDLDLTPLDTQNVTDMGFMFCGCSRLTSLDLTPLDTSNVTNMNNMFSSCSGLTSLDLSPLDTKNVTNMGGMFSSCSGLTNLDLSPLDTQKVTYMGNMFLNCPGLKSLDLSLLDTKNVTDMGSMFFCCSGLTSLDLTSLNTQKVTNMYQMFVSCSALTRLTTGTTFKFVGTDYVLSGTWQNTAGETFNGNYNTANFPSNVADTYTKIPS